MMYDVVIANGWVIDGTGKERYVADVGIVGDRIESVARLAEAPREQELDASGRVVCPGFVDPHNHANSEQKSGILRIPQADNMLRQGVTTLICAHCGGSAFPIGEHLSEVEKLRFQSNYATLVGYGTVNGHVRRGKTPGNPTGEEMQEIRGLLAQAMEEGAVGMTTGPLGQPQDVMSTAEMTEASKTVAEYGGVYDSHIRDEGEWGHHLDAIQEVIEIARSAGISANISHLKLWGRRAWGDGERVLAMLDRAAADGLAVSADQYAYTGGYRGLGALVADTRLKYPDDELFSKGRTECLDEIRDQFYQLGGADRVILCPHDGNPELNGKTIHEVAVARRVSDEECALDLLQASGLSACWLAMREEEVRLFMQSPHVMVGTDAHLRVPHDGHCHPRNYGNYPRFLGVYVREQNVLTFEQAIHKMTAKPARKFGLRRRGVIEQGACADIVVFDPGTVIDRATWAEPHQYSVGIEHVLVNGQLAVHDGETTGALAGRVLRRGDG